LHQTTSSDVSHVWTGSTVKAVDDDKQKVEKKKKGKEKYKKSKKRVFHMFMQKPMAV